MAERDEHLARSKEEWANEEYLIPDHAAGCNVGRLLELLDLYMEMVEKQDEIIYRLSKIVVRQETDLQLLRNDCKFSDMLSEDKKIANEVLSQYEQMKGTE